MTVLQILISAAELVRNGWTQNDNGFTTVNGIECYCPLTAVITAENTDYLSLECKTAAIYLSAAVRQLYPEFFTTFTDTSVIRWNDTLGRTKDEVLVVMALAIDKARQDYE